MLVYFVRHGESQGNSTKTYDDTDSPLSNLGIRQSQFVAKRFTHIHIDKIIASTYKRASQTAEAISNNIKVDIDYSESAIECGSPNEIIGKKFDDPKAIDVIQQIHDHDGQDWRYSNEETIQEMIVRSQKFIKNLEKLNHKSVLVVSHSFFITSIIGSMLFGSQFAPKMFRHFRQSMKINNTSLTLCEYDKEKANWSLITWNDHSHLG